MSSQEDDDPKRPKDERDPIEFDRVVDEPEEDEEDDEGAAERRENDGDPPVRIGPPTGI